MVGYFYFLLGFRRLQTVSYFFDWQGFRLCGGELLFCLAGFSTSAEVDSHFSQEKCQNCHSSSGLLMSRLAVVAKGTPVVLRTSVGALSRSSASRDGESGIIGIQNLYYAAWFTKTPF